jgi:hypothetical protein
MSTDSVMDLMLNTQIELPKDFTCFCKILILSPHLTKLSYRFLYRNIFVKTLDMSKCTNITRISDDFCGFSHIENIIWSPNVSYIRNNCLEYNNYIQTINLSYCNQLMYIESNFCCHTNIVNIFLPVSIQKIDACFFQHNKALTNLDLSYCVHLFNIGDYFSKDTNIQSIIFPKSLQTILHGICFNSKNVKELDFSKCKDIKISTLYMCEVETLKIYSIDNICTENTIHCKNLHIYNITETKTLDLSFIEDLRNVYLPEGEYCIINSHLDIYSNIKFWLQSSAHSADYFRELKWYSYIPVPELAMLDTSLETI